MKKIDTRSGYDYNKLFDALKDKENSKYEKVGEDLLGNFILHISGTYRSGNSYQVDDVFYILDETEYAGYVEKARKSGLIHFWNYGRLLKKASHEKAMSGNITSFDTVTLHTSGMRHTTDHEIVMKDGMAEVSRYALRYENGEKKRVLEKRAVCGAETVLKLLNDCGLLSWDGFRGSHPKGVKDGTMFTLQATVNGDKTIRASGSQNFPRNYRDFTDGLYLILNNAENNE